MILLGPLQPYCLGIYESIRSHEYDEEERSCQLQGGETDSL